MADLQSVCAAYSEQATQNCENLTAGGYGDEVQALVIDNGSAMIKAGFAGDDAPRGKEKKKEKEKERERFQRSSNLTKKENEKKARKQKHKQKRKKKGKKNM